MIINANTITFEQTDILALPAETQKALAQYDQGTSAAESLSAATNAFLAAVVALASVRSLGRFKAALDSAPADKQALAEAKLNEAKVILGIQTLPKRAV